MAIAKKIVKKTVKTKATAEKPVKKVSAVPKVNKPAAMRDDARAYKLLQAPVITERTTDLAAMNKYVFAVPVSANKSEVKKTIINLYGITPTKVNMIRVRANNVRFGRTFGKQKSWKKAIVTLPAGKTIGIYEGV
jgi:large subunit ribosomal protein L23